MRRGRPTIAQSPLDALIPQAGQGEETREPNATGGRPPKERLTVHVDAATIDRARDAVYWTPGLTLAALTEAALTRELARMEAERGGPFENRTADIPRGRRIV